MVIRHQRWSRFKGAYKSPCLRPFSLLTVSTILRAPVASRFVFWVRAELRYMTSPLSPASPNSDDSREFDAGTNLDAGPNFDAGTSGLLPVIAQDHRTGRVLMMAWMNRAAYEETLKTRQACYYSRSRKSLWRKGETSGHRQRVLRIQFDCDADCILMQVEQQGAACHDGYASCFYRTVQDDLSISIDEPRLVDPADVYSQKS